jgi:hypothetical protein
MSMAATVLAMAALAAAVLLTVFAVVMAAMAMRAGLVMVAGVLRRADPPVPADPAAAGRAQGPRALSRTRGLRDPGRRPFDCLPAYLLRRPGRWGRRRRAGRRR